MTARNSIISMLFVCISCLVTMVFVDQRWYEQVAGPLSSLVPFISIILFVVVIFTLALRQPLTMYVASIIALSTIAHFYILPYFSEQQALLNSPLMLTLQTDHLLMSFILLLPIFGLITIPAHKNLYLLAIAVMAAYAIAKPSQVSIVLLACLASLLCLYSAIMNSRNMAFNDELTNIPARRSLTQYAEELSRHFTVVMIDVDHFKRFNDKYGHDSGDDVLKLVASRIAKTRNGARAFRYGGEEFTLVFDGKYIDDVRETIEDLRVEIESYPMAIRVQKRGQKSASQSRNRRQSPQRQEIVKVTCSFGIAESLSGSKDFKPTLKRADNALYKAKKAGRNCVRTA